jgi:hypothetical protein
VAEDFDLDALAYYRETNVSIYGQLGAGLILGNSLLTARGIPASIRWGRCMLADTRPVAEQYHEARWWSKIRRDG